MNISRIKEFARYDWNGTKFILLPFIKIKETILKHNSPNAHLAFLSGIFRLAWPGTFALCLNAFKKNHLDNANSLKKTSYDDLLNNIEDIERYRTFIENPEKLLNGVITVVAPHTENSKGVIVIAYSYYFVIFLKAFNIINISKRYHIVLEPSWNGMCDPAILAFSYIKEPVFVMAYEDRDYNFINELKSNLVAVRLSANWFIDKNKFKDCLPKENRDIDIIMVAAWAKFKRHDVFFKAIKKLRDEGHNYKITLVGYPNDLERKDIIKLAEKIGINDQITIYEWISSTEVSELLGRAKVNIIWSRFEGLNRAIIEGMFCNTPCIIRDGFNFGMKYPYINRETGEYSSESGLSDKIREVIKNFDNYSPRKYVLSNHNCEIATDILAKTIAATDPNFKVENILVKTSELNGMKYLREADEQSVEKDYLFLEKSINN